MTYDLHTHSTASDGAYTPTELVRRAAEAGVGHLALSDHDCTDGLAEAERAASLYGLRLIPAVEVSVSWQGKSVHIVGLNISAACASLQTGLQGLQATRRERALEMGKRLAKEGIPGAYEAAYLLAGDGMITRTHFAHFLVTQGLSPSVKDVFGRYLTPGKPGYVSTEWAGLEAAVSWIREAGGIAAVAHPQRYKMTGSWLRRLFAEFKEAGGEAMEVISGTSSPNDIQTMAQHAKRFGLLASLGSDFHSPEHSWLKLGKLPPLPEGLTPVWSRWHA
ncbi:PHP domain-containing protein [Methylococcus sp. EFPC2]|uniref:PHP domain-containing protein n=1 Tax=Methylococcus sp. EFPC2 TaxID=2812648 RepID=UPI0019687CD9|nr:PHP domain-containing protein [Methylococcus sp. EFPC2]QSA96979.1 PHP domain-containing protein [Methylococcus sp. EFPC2]